jgi:hypothetical protein
MLLSEPASAALVVVEAMDTRLLMWAGGEAVGSPRPLKISTQPSRHRLPVLRAMHHMIGHARAGFVAEPF